MSIEDLQQALLHATGEHRAHLLYRLGDELSKHAQSMNEPRYLNEALTAYEEALTLFRAFGQLGPQLATLNNIGIVQRELAQQLQSVIAYEEAVEAFKKALSIEVGDADADRLMVLNNLGNTYQQLAELDRPIINLNHARAALVNAIDACDAKVAPLVYASLHNNLGNIYVALAEHVDTHQNLNHALAAYQETLLNTNPAQDAPAYASLQNNLGMVCHKLAAFEDRERNLERALTGFNEALKVFTRDTGPLAYATLQANIGMVQRERGENSAASHAFLEAADVVAVFGAHEEAEHFYQLAEQLSDNGGMDAD